MSLINEALKKAQRMRHLDAAATPGAADGSGPIVKRAQPKSARSMILIVAGAVVLIVISMVLTALWLTRSPSSPTVAKAKAVAPAVTETTPPPPLVTLPTPTTPSSSSIEPLTVAAPAPIAVPPPVAKKATASVDHPISSPKPPPAPKAAVQPTPAVPPPVPAPETVEAPPAKPDERIHQFVESIRVTGIRSSGNESKVLMNDRVYRVNDVVDRGLGVRLTKVSPDSLTFTDEHGATYVKYF